MNGIRNEDHVRSTAISGRRRALVDRDRRAGEIGSRSDPTPKWFYIAFGVIIVVVGGLMWWAGSMKKKKK